MREFKEVEFGGKVELKYQEFYCEGQSGLVSSGVDLFGFFLDVGVDDSGIYQEQGFYIFDLSFCG